MSERTFRIIQGVYLLAALFLEIDMMMYIFIGVFLFEAVTNWRIPILVSRLRYGTSAKASQAVMLKSTRFGFEAERMLRVAVAILLYISAILYPDILWVFPWFIAVMLALAGITKICPMVLFFRYCGFR